MFSTRSTVSIHPKVTVCMAMYNGAAYVAEAISSILRQTMGDLELLILDDGSRDDSVAKVRAFRDPRVRLIHNEKNRGLVYTRNRLFAEARAPYVAIFDCDDISPPHRIKLQYQFLRRHPDFAYVGAWLEIFDQSGMRTLWTYDGHEERNRVGMLFYNRFADAVCMINKKFLPDPPCREEFPIGLDYDLWSRMLRCGRFANLQQVLLYYRQHGASITHDQQELKRACTAKVVLAELANFGIEPSDEELALHQAIAMRRPLPQDDFYQRAEAWLLHLQEHNRSTRIFSQRAFAQVINDLWYHLLLLRWDDEGPALLLRFFQSSLGRAIPGGLKGYYRIMRRILSSRLSKRQP